MSKKHFSWLLAITLIVAIVVMLVPGKTAKENLFESRALLPDLAGRVNDIERVEIIGQGPTTAATLERLEDGWVVAEAAYYSANWESLRTLLKDLAQAEIIEDKTSNPEFYSRLGVEDLSEPEAAGVMIVLSAPDEVASSTVEVASSTDEVVSSTVEVASVIIGKAAQGRQGRYVRLTGSDQSALIGTQLRVASDIQSWLQRSIVDISASEIVEYTIAHPDGEVVSATKASADDADFQLQGIPEGRQTKSAWSVNQVGGGLASLQLDDVRKAADIDWTEAIHFSLLSADGLLVSADLVEEGDDRWIRVAASGVARDEVVEADSEPVEPPAAKPESTEPAAPEEAAENLADRVNSINQRVGGWAYRIATYKYDAMAKRMEDMLEEVETSEADE